MGVGCQAYDTIIMNAKYTTPPPTTPMEDANCPMLVRQCAYKSITGTDNSGVSMVKRKLLFGDGVAQEIVAGVVMGL